MFWGWVWPRLYVVTAFLPQPGPGCSRSSGHWAGCGPGAGKHCMPALQGTSHFHSSVCLQWPPAFCSIRLQWWSHLSPLQMGSATSLAPARGLGSCGVSPALLAVCSSSPLLGVCLELWPVLPQLFAVTSIVRPQFSVYQDTSLGIRNSSSVASVRIGGVMCPAIFVNFYKVQRAIFKKKT